LIWRHMSEKDQFKYFSLAEDVDAAGEHLAAVLKLPDYKHDTRQSVRLDYATHVLNFGRRLALPPVKMSALFTISQSVLEVAATGGMRERAQEILQSFLVGLCRAEPTPDDYFLSVEQIGAVAKFFAGSLLERFAAFRFLFTREQPRREAEVSLLFETIQLRQDFHEAFIEEEWQRHNEELAAKAEAERAAAEEVRRQEEEKARKQAEEQAAMAAERRRQAEMAKVPQSLDEAVNQLVAMRLSEEKQKLEAAYKEREAELLHRIGQLEEEARKSAGSGGKGGRRK